jgi:2-polyprenyl-3-methyl-5-hydroxy-6-metoxy-1,4-benzoquinol methylase
MQLPEIPVEISDHYEHDYDESQRISNGFGELELIRTREIIERYLPSGRLRVLDVGGGTGVHARWLARDGHDVELVDPMPRHVAAAQELASEGLSVTAHIGDARALTQADNSADVVLLLGPLYHLTERDDRLRAWHEALRVAKPGGLVVAAVVSRFASLFSGLSLNLLADTAFYTMAQRDLREGQHRNPDRTSGWFTTAYFHHPDEIVAEAAEAGAQVVELFGVEGLAAWLPQLGDDWSDPTWRERIVASARAVETEPTLRGLSAHLLLVTHKPAAAR